MIRMSNILIYVPYQNKEEERPDNRSLGYPWSPKVTGAGCDKIPFTSTIWIFIQESEVINLISIHNRYFSIKHEIEWSIRISYNNKGLTCIAFVNWRKRQYFLSTMGIFLSNICLSGATTRLRFEYEFSATIVHININAIAGFSLY